MAHYRPSIEQKIKEAREMKKGLSAKTLVPRLKDDPIADPEVVKVPIEWDDPDYTAEIWKDFKANDKYNRHKSEEKNSKLQDYIEKYQNHFPIEVFPSSIQAYIKDLELCTNASVEYTAAGILTAVAGAIGNKFYVELKSDMINPTSLYMVIIGKTGTNKSNPLKTALAPLFAKEKEYSRLYEIDKRKYLKLKDEDKEQVEPPKEKRCIVNDITMEALLDVLEDNAITVYCDEFQGFLNSMNKYRSGDDMEKWLSIYSGTPIRSDRKNKRGVLIPNPFVNCIGTIQPDVLLNFLSKNNTNNGFNERLLYVTTNHVKSSQWNTIEPNSELKDGYFSIINSIFQVEPTLTQEGEIAPVLITFNEEGLKAAIEWQHKNSLLCETVTDAQFAGIYRKLEIYMLRFALISAVLDFADKKPAILCNKKARIRISDKHVASAIMITEFFRNGAKEIYSLKPNKITIKSAIEQAFFDNLKDHFTTEQALEIGQQLKISERSVFYYLNKDIFRQVTHGQYEKNYKYENCN